jgi:HSP20 family protein
MTLVKRNSGDLPVLPKLFDDFFLKDFWNPNVSSLFSGRTIPQVNLVETKDAFEIAMAVPGLEKKDFKIELENEIIRISCSKEESSSDAQFIRREFNYQSFERTFYLPKKVVDNSKVEASYKNGLLHVIVPKKEEAKALPARTIQIK